jgi:hypothetical protein
VRPGWPTRVRGVSIFLDKNRRSIGKPQSTRPPQWTQRPRTSRPSLVAVRAATASALGLTHRVDFVACGRRWARACR